MSDHERLQIALADGSSVGGLAQSPVEALACYVLAHGAGAGMEHPFMSSIANRLSDLRIATLRYQFPYMEQGSKRPDRPAIAHAAVRAAVKKAAEVFPGLPLFAGGKSFGGRMTSQAEAAEALPAVRGLVFLGFPLHEAGKPASDRATHLAEITVPMLFIQGTRDPMAESERIHALATSLGTKARLVEIVDADHSFHVPKRSGRTDDDALSEAARAVSDWIKVVLESPLGNFP